MEEEDGLAFGFLFGLVAFDIFGAQVDQNDMGVGAMGDRVEAAFDQLIRQGLGAIGAALLAA